MKIVIDASVVLAVLFCEPEREKIISLTKDCDLKSPQSLPFEIGNAISSAFKKSGGKLSLDDGLKVMQSFSSMEITLENICFERAIEISHFANIYAYDAYMIELAEREKCCLFTLDRKMKMYADYLNVKLMEIEK
jgi:predicted nucleic acid-binding protein